MPSAVVTSEEGLRLWGSKTGMTNWQKRGHSTVFHSPTLPILKSAPFSVCFFCGVGLEMLLTVKASWFVFPGTKVAESRLDVFLKICKIFKEDASPKLTGMLFSHQAVSDSLQPRGLQHTRLPCPSPLPGVCPSSYPLSW